MSNGNVCIRRKLGQAIIINAGGIESTVTISEVKGKQVVLLVQAPKETVRISRAEKLEKKIEEGEG